MKSLAEDNQSLKSKLKAIIRENNGIKQEINQVFEQDNEHSNQKEDDK